MDKGVHPFTMRASTGMTMFIQFEESIGCRGLTQSWTEKRMQNMAGKLYGILRKHTVVPWTAFPRKILPNDPALRIIPEATVATELFVKFLTFISFSGCEEKIW
jgi:hypothetical protein